MRIILSDNIDTEFTVCIVIVRVYKDTFCIIWSTLCSQHCGYSITKTTQVLCKTNFMQSTHYG